MHNHQIFLKIPKVTPSPLMDLFKHFPLLMTSPHRDLKYAKELTDRYSSHHFQNKENDSSPTKIKTGSI